MPIAFLLMVAAPSLDAPASQPVTADDDEPTGACNCVIAATGQSWCTETTPSWCSTYSKSGVVSCSWSGGSCSQ